MQILKNSIVIRLFRILYVYYSNSFAKQIVLRLATAYRNSILGKTFSSIANRESAMTGSVFIRIIRTVFNIIDRFVIWVSKTISNGAGSSLIVGLYRGVINSVGEKSVALLLPLFGMGYVFGRVIQGRLMIRDILFLGLMFIIGAIFMVDSDKRKTVFKSSLISKVFKLILE
jgi:hypothetical protein